LGEFFDIPLELIYLIFNRKKCNSYKISEYMPIYTFYCKTLDIPVPYIKLLCDGEQIIDDDDDDDDNDINTLP